MTIFTFLYVSFFRVTGSYFTCDSFYVPYRFMWPDTSGFVMVVAISQLSTKVTYGFHMVFFIYGPTLQLTLRTYILGWVSTSKTIFGHWTRFWYREVRNTPPFTLLYFFLKILSICSTSFAISSLKIHLLSWWPTFRVNLMEIFIFYYKLSWDDVIMILEASFILNSIN